MNFSSRSESLYRTVIRISCSPYFVSPSNSNGTLNGTGESVSISSIKWVDGIILESPIGSSVTNPNKATSFPSLIISPITVGFPDKSITLTS